MKRISLIFATIFITQNLFGATINLEFFNDNGLTSPSSTGMCTVGGTIGALPTPTKPGHIFKGWKVFQTCGINNLDIFISSDVFYSHNFEMNNYDTCAGYDRGYPCTDTPDIGIGEWKAEFSYGTIYGEMSCNSTPYTTNPYGGSSTYTLYEGNKKPGNAFSKNTSMPSGDQKYCWCRITGLKPSGKTNRCVASASAWVSEGGGGSAEHCAGSCAYFCSDSISYYTGFREALFNAVNINGWKYYRTCGINGLDTSIRGSEFYSHNYVKDDPDTCAGDDRGYPCSDTPDIVKGEWKTKFSYGTIYGEASCISEGGTPKVSKKEMNEISKNSAYYPDTWTGNEKYCWCRITGLKVAKQQCAVSSSPWLYRWNHTTAESCADSCAYFCSENTYQYSAEFREALFKTISIQ